MQEVSLIASFIAGLLSFLSPCVLPIVPGYISYISGVSFQQASEQRGFNSKAFISSVLFVLGFSVAFSAMGATATTIGSFLKEYQDFITKVGGAIVVFFGLHFSGLLLNEEFKKISIAVASAFMGLFAMGFLDRELFGTFAGIFFINLALVLLEVDKALYNQLRGESSKKVAGLGAFLMGLLFAFGWSPCIGPVLGAILIYASSQETAIHGAMLLLSYSMGLGLPFIIAGGLISGFLGFVKSFSKYFPVVEAIGGILLIVAGIGISTGKLAELSLLLGS
ncbi:MAG: cytochrome c biogenesis protein CcdA [Aquificaceae bacterium]